MRAHTILVYIVLQLNVILQSVIYGWQTPYVYVLRSEHYAGISTT